MVPGAQSKDMDKIATRISVSQKAFDQFDFVSSINKLRRKTAKQLKRNHGFPNDKVDEFRKQFAAYDLDRKGFLEDREVQKLIEKLYFDLASKAGYRPQLLEIMKPVQKGETDFSTFLRICRKCTDLRDREKVMRERDAIEQTGFTVLEVKEIRELFLENTADDVISLPELLKMLANVMPMGEKNAAALAEIFMEVVGEDLDQSAEFADFLLITRRMLDEDPGSINEFARGYL